MILGLLQQKHRREPLQLQLTAMIDIFSMIVIFLIFGTVFGAADIIIPPQLKIPSSYSKEAIESAIRLVIEKDHIRTSLIDTSYPLSSFRPGNGSDPRTADLKAKIKANLAVLKTKSKASEKLLNIIADQNTPYQDIFDVTRVFREAGFDTLLFVAHGEKAPK